MRRTRRALDKGQQDKTQLAEKLDMVLAANTSIQSQLNKVGFAFYFFLCGCFHGVHFWT